MKEGCEFFLGSPVDSQVLGNRKYFVVVVGGCLHKSKVTKPMLS